MGLEVGCLEVGWFSKLGSLLGSFVVRYRTILGTQHGDPNLETYPFKVGGWGFGICFIAPKFRGCREGSGHIWWTRAL